MASEIWYLEKASYLSYSGVTKVFPIAIVKGSYVVLHELEDHEALMTDNYTISGPVLVVKIDNLTFEYKKCSHVPIEIDIAAPSHLISIGSIDTTILISHAINSRHSQYKTNQNLFLEIYRVLDFSVVYLFDTDKEEFSFGFFVMINCKITFLCSWSSFY